MLGVLPDEMTVLSPEDEGKFLMDEPLANLDAKLRVSMRTELQRLHRQLDTTIVYVTHNQAEAMTMADRIAVLDGGELQQIDPPLTCYNEPANLFVAGFIGSPSMNFMAGEVTDDGLVTDHFELDFDPSSVDGVRVGQQVTMGVRPEDVYPSNKVERLEASSKRIRATTDVLEPMGDEIFVYLLFGDEDASMDMESRGGGQLLMSVDPDSTIAEDEDVEVVLDRSKIHLFDSASGEAIVHGMPSREAVGERPGPETRGDV